MRSEGVHSQTLVAMPTNLRVTSDAQVFLAMILCGAYCISPCLVEELQAVQWDWTNAKIKIADREKMVEGLGTISSW